MSNARTNFGSLSASGGSSFPFSLIPSRVAKFQEENKMSVENLGIVFGPTLMRPPNDQPAIDDLYMLHFQKKSVELLIDEFDALFVKWRPNVDVVFDHCIENSSWVPCNLISIFLLHLISYFNFLDGDLKFQVIKISIMKLTEFRFNMCWTSLDSRAYLG